jgi:lipoate-protein ligase A
MGSELMHQILNPSTDPYFNIALEEYLITQTDDSSEWFMLWQNKPAVIVGRYQNTNEEVNATIIQENQIEVVRRMSGGGAVYHDLGNLNFTLVVTSSSDRSYSRFAQPVLKALHKLGVEAQLTGRNDLTVGGRKFSGNAQYIGKKRLLHHGTLLFNTDLDIMQRVLNVDVSKMASKGVKSVRSRVTNLAEHLPASVSIDAFRSNLSHTVGEFWPLEPARRLTQWEEDRVRQLADRKYRRWEWNYGQSPEYDLRRQARYPWGQIDIRLEMKQGRITGCKIYGDFFAGQDISALEQALQGIVYDRNEVLQRLESLELHEYVPEMEVQQWLELIMGNEN